MSDFAPFYCCYFLQSIEHRQSFYVGSSPNPVRRLRQHNGELVRGGAYRTKRSGTRPWEMLMIVYGFPNKIVALQFEHAWQHGYKTRFIQEEDRLINKKNSGSAGRNVNYKLALVRQLLNHRFFKFMNLGVQFFNSDVKDIWDTNKFAVTLDPYYTKWNCISISEGAQSLKKYDLKNLTIDELTEIADANKDLVTEFYDTSLAKDKERIEQYLEILMNGIMDCSVCGEKFDYTSEDIDMKPYISFCLNDDCRCVSHLDCLCEKFIQDDTDIVDKSMAIIPLGGECSKCNQKLKWTSLVKYSLTLKEKSYE
ncbi:endonuclease [Maudiozyma humilis]|uniref:Endonuclease n=1 Tax=Maudiozyma humilis TaxID=51915 RepID=A0AAV5RTV6_MAUHU|nr:endonuclease [Kazachstania humilis]